MHAPNTTKATWNPADYSRNSSQQQKWARELIAKLALKGDEQILDIGCGDGKVSAELASHVPHGSVLGLDSSAEMVEFAARAFPTERYPNLSFMRGDASRLEFQSRFDVIFSNATLHWIWDHHPVLAGIFAALKPGGRILVQMGGKGCAADVLSVINSVTSQPEWKSYFDGFTFRHGFHGPDEYRQWLTRAGLTPVRVELFPRDMVHRGPEGLAGWLRTTWMPYLNAVPESRRDEFLYQLVAEFVARHPPDADGNVHVGMVRIEYQATRPG